MTTETTLQFITAGSLLGLSAGLSPGPLFTLLITQTMKHNQSEGMKVALSPLITDFPIIIITLFIFTKLSQFNNALAITSFIGSGFIAFLGYESLKTKSLSIDKLDLKSDSMRKGIVANLLSPGLYIFWATIGTPLIFRAYEIRLSIVILFIISFYLFLIGSNIAIAVIVSRSKRYIQQKAYIWIMRFLGVLLLLFSLMFLYDGFRYLE